jgi:5-methylcytosine-specific restriction endonuclease McrA
MARTYSSRKYTKEILEEAVTQSVSFAGVTRYLQIPVTGSNQTHIKKMVVKFEIDFTHFTGKLWSKGKFLPQSQLTSDELLIVSQNDTRTKVALLKRALLERGKIYECEHCLISDVYNNKSLTLHIDHIDGDWKNNIETNLRFLCPNCHSQTNTYGGRNKK